MRNQRVKMEISDWRGMCVPGREEDGSDDCWFAYNPKSGKSVRAANYEEAKKLSRELSKKS